MLDKKLWPKFVFVTSSSIENSHPEHQDRDHKFWRVILASGLGCRFALRDLYRVVTSLNSANRKWTACCVSEFLQA